MSKYTLFFDGGNRIKECISGAGAVIYSEKQTEVATVSVFIEGNATNNQAEYLGLIEGVNMALENNVRELIIKGDSMLVVNQIKGDWKCKNSKLQEYKKEALSLLSKLDKFEIHHVYRRYNTRADELANKAMDSHTII